MADLYRHCHKGIPEPYPPGMPIKLPSHDDDPADYTTAIVSSIPIRTAEGDAVQDTYLLQYRDNSTVTRTLMGQVNGDGGNNGSGVIC